MRLHTLLPQAVGAVGKWESRFWISTFPRPTVKELRFGFLFGQVGTVGAVEMWESRGLCEIPKGCGRRARPGVGRARLPWPVISTALRKNSGVTESRCSYRDIFSLQ